MYENELEIALSFVPHIRPDKPWRVEFRSKVHAKADYHETRVMALTAIERYVARDKENWIEENLPDEE